MQILAYLCHLPSLGCVVVWGASAVTPLHEVWWVAPSAGVGGSTLLLLLLNLTLRGVFFLLSLLPCLSVALIVLLVVARGAPSAWVPPESVPVSRILAALHWNATRAGNVGCLGTLKEWRQCISPNSIDTHLVWITDAEWRNFLEVILKRLLYCSLGRNVIFNQYLVNTVYVRDLTLFTLDPLGLCQQNCVSTIVKRYCLWLMPLTIARRLLLLLG